MKKTLLRLIAFIGILPALSQSNLGFFHMQNKMPQSSNYNPSYFPDAKVYVCLPAISGVDLTVNNSFGLSDLLKPTGDSTLVDIDNFLRERTNKPYLNVGLGLTDFMVGVRLDSSSHFSLFINERTDATLFYPMDLLRFAWSGNGDYIDEPFIADDFSFDATHYREFGAGYSRSFSIAGRPVNIGLRLKYLVGIFHASTSESLNLSIRTNEPDYSVAISLDPIQVRTAGIGQVENIDDLNISYLIHNKNTGFGIDLGGQMQFSEKWRFGVSVTDLGMIRWKENTEILQFDEFNYEYNGLSFDNLDGLGQDFLDSIDNWQADTLNSGFTTTLNSRSYFTADYLVTKGGYAQATIGNYVTQGKIKPAFGLGYIQSFGRWFSASATVSVAPQQGVDVGGGLMLRLTPFQLYVVADNLLNTIDIPEANSANIKFGLNIIIGRQVPKKKKAVVETPSVPPPDPSTYEYPNYRYLWDNKAKKQRQKELENESGSE